MAVQTGFKSGATTSADVFFVIHGSQGETAPKRLHNPKKRSFKKGETDFFLLATPYSLGIINAVEIWHNNAGPSPGWHLFQIQVSFNSYVFDPWFTQGHL